MFAVPHSLSDKWMLKANDKKCYLSSESITQRMDVKSE